MEDVLKGLISDKKGKRVKSFSENLQSATNLKTGLLVFPYITLPGDSRQQ